MAWFHSKFRREALVVAALILHWCSIGRVSGTTTVSMDPTPLATISMDPTPSATISMDPTPSATISMDPTPSATISMDPTPSTTISMDPTPLTTTSMDPTPSATISMDPTPSATISMDPTPLTTTSMDPTPSATISMDPTPSATISMDPTPLTTTSMDPTPSTTISMDPTPLTTTSMDPTPLTTTSMDPTPSATISMDPTPSATISMDPTPSATISMDPTPSATISMDPTPSATISMDPTPSATISMDPTPSATISMDPTPSATISMDPTPSAAISMDPTPSAAISMDPTPSATISMDPTPSATISMDPTPSATISMDPTPSATISMDPTPSATISMDLTPSATISMDPTPSVTISMDPTPLTTTSMDPTPVPTATPLIRFVNQAEETPNVVIFMEGEAQFVLDNLEWTLAVADNETLELDITLVEANSFSEIDINERGVSTIPQDFRFGDSVDGTTRTISVPNLNRTTTDWALQSLTYTYYNRTNPESVSDTFRDPISVTLIQGGNRSTINFTAQYRGDNLAPPILVYNPAGDDVRYIEDDYDGVPIMDGNFTIEDSDHPSYLLQSATIEIINYNSEDQLLLTNTTLMSSYKNGVLNITMEASIEEYEAAINSVVYNNTVKEPTSDIKRITINVTDSPVFDGTNTSNSINLTVNVVNVDEPPNPVLNNLYLTENTGPVMINLTTIDSTDPMDNYTNASLEFTPVNAEVESISFNGPYPPGIDVVRTDYNITVAGLGSKADYNYILRNVIYQWNSTNGNLGSGYLTLTVTDCTSNTTTVTANISVNDVIDDIPIFGFAADDVNRNSVVYPTTLTTVKVIEYDIIDSIYFLNNAYLRDDRQLKNVTIEVTGLAATDTLTWNGTLQEALGIDYTDASDGVNTLHIFSGDIYDELQWEMFLMSFSFLQDGVRADDRDVGNRTINVTAQDCSNSVTLTTIINVLPLPPVVMITVDNITFTERDNFTLIRNEFPIAVEQDQDAMFVSLTITLQIDREGMYELGPTEMINTVTAPTTLMRSLIQTATVHTVEFSKSDGITNEIARQAIRSIVYLNYELEPRAFDNTGAPLLRKITISTVDVLSRSFQTSFYITIVPVNDNPPVIRLFTSGNCSLNSTAPSRKKVRSTAPQESKRIKHHSTVQQEHQMVPYITEIYGELTDKKCAAYIVIHFSAPVSHPYVDIWPRLSLVLSLSPRYLSDQWPMGTWDDQDTLIITFPEHNCSEWNYNGSHVTFKPSNEPCHSPVECLTGVCHSNYTGCRITGTFAFNFTASHDGATIDCLYPPTSASLIPNTWAVNILVVIVMFLLGAITFYCIWKYISKRLHATKDDVACDTLVHDQPSRSMKHKRRRRLNKSSTLAKLASTSVAKQQQVNDVSTERSHDYHHGDDDRTLLFPDKGDDIVLTNCSAVEDIVSEKDVTVVTSKTAGSPAAAEYKVTRTTKDKDTITSHSTTVTSSDNSSQHDGTLHISTPRRPIITDSAFPSDTS